ncbi:RNA exonuclease 4 isoform X1 [Elephas maximus indicus]|uniref:RNA exonuclease 4 isoform X1 n=2 Tax=Elephas maximus indicus TaxID=99487 RepID=UPI00211705E9|nr:RNA exonuclease 4 isoform X1 [Elephas maximus indicus]
MVKAKVPAPRRARSSPAAKPGPVGRLRRRKNRKGQLGKSKAREVNKKQGSGPRLVLRPPKAPEDFSQNWKALQELLKQKPQTPEKPLVTSQMGFKKQPKVTQQNRSVGSDPAEGGKVEQPGPAGSSGPEASGGSEPAGFPRARKAPAPPTEAPRPEPDEKETAKRTPHGAISPTRGDTRQKRQKAEVAAPALPTEDDIWFDDVDPEDIEAAIGPEAANIARKRLGQRKSSITLVKEQGFSGLTRALALDCEMVGVGPKGEESIAARVSIVNQHGKCVYDKYIRPAEPVTDYRTAVSGIRPENLKQGEELAVVQEEVAEMLKGRILVGHALHNDLKVLFLDHPKKKVRDTQKYKPFKSQVKSGRPSLKLLSQKILGIRVQEQEHCSIQDAQAAMRLYIMVKKEWESAAKDKLTTAAAPDSHRT